jgi:RimJ/RimL family protein N-acetyltransferase
MAFELQPVLKGELLELRPLRPDDFEALYAVAADPLVWEQHPQRDRYKREVFEPVFRDGLASGGALTAVERSSGLVIGSSRYNGYSAAEREIEIGWSFLGRAYWGGVYNGEMKRLMLRHAFRFVDRVVFLIGPDNLRSQRAVEKLGGVRAEPRIDGKGQLRVVYVIEAASFEL